MEILFSLILVALLVGAFIVSGSFGGLEISTDKIGPAGFPRMIIIICLFLMVLILRDLIRKPKEQSKSLTPRGVSLIALNVGLFGLYLFFLNVIGFILSTFLYGTVAIRTMGYKSLKKNALFMLILTVLITLIFGRIFYVSLPRGLGFMRQLSYLAY